MGNIEYFSMLMREECVIDVCENFVKQTHRSRCEILSANGVSTLTVNVCNGSSIRKTAVKDMRIDNTRRWQHQHRLALISAYKNSPYFDHYWDKIEPFYLKQYEFLVDLNMDVLRTLMSIFKIDRHPVFSENYIVAGSGDSDLRSCFPRKSGSNVILADAMSAFEATNNLCVQSNNFQQYYQVFSEKFLFSPNLSVIDLVFCEGPSAKSFLKY